MTIEAKRQVLQQNLQYARGAAEYWRGVARRAKDGEHFVVEPIGRSCYKDGSWSNAEPNYTAREWVYPTRELAEEAVDLVDGEYDDIEAVPVAQYAANFAKEYRAVARDTAAHLRDMEEE